MTQFVRIAGVALALTAAAVFPPPPAKAAPDAALLAKMAGRWNVALSGNTGCGSSAMFVSFTLNSAGVATNATIKGNSTGCPQQVSTGETFTVLQLNAKGVGKAGLSCGVGCGWTFNIAVAEGGALFVLADVSDLNNTPAGTAVKIIPPTP